MPHALDREDAALLSALRAGDEQVFCDLVMRWSGPMLRLVNRGLNAKRYRGTQGQKLKQTEQMRRHLDQKRAALKHVQGQLEAARKRKGR